MAEVFYFQCYMAITVAFRDGGWCMSVLFCLLNVEYAVISNYSPPEIHDNAFFEHELPLIHDYYMIIHVMI